MKTTVMCDVLILFISIQKWQIRFPEDKLFKSLCFNLSLYHHIYYWAAAITDRNFWALLHLQFPVKTISRAHIVLPYRLANKEFSINFETLNLFFIYRQVPSSLQHLHSLVFIITVTNLIQSSHLNN